MFFLSDVNSYIIQGLKRRNIGATLINYWDVLFSYKLLHQSAVVFRRVKNVWRKKTWENVRCMLILKSYPDFFGLFYHFHQFQYNATNTFGKSYLNSKFQFRWANVCVQICSGPK